MLGRTAWWFLVSALLVGPCFAQYSSSIQGVGADSSGAAIGGASVTLRNVNTGIEQSTATSSSGNYSFTSLAPGRYVVRAESKGFRTIEVQVTLGTGNGGHQHQFTSRFGHRDHDRAD